jgi:hypothetical protein
MPKLFLANSVERFELTLSLNGEQFFRIFVSTGKALSHKNRTRSNRLATV